MKLFYMDSSYWYYTIHKEEIQEKSVRKKKRIHRYSETFSIESSAQRSQSPLDIGAVQVLAVL